MNDRAAHSRTDWRALARAAGLKPEGDEVIVRFESGRTQRVRVIEGEDGLLIRSIAARRSAWDGTAVQVSDLWRRNRSLQLVGLRIDEHDRIVAEAHLPTDDLHPQEFALYDRTVAAEADRLEFWLTGKDVE